MRARHRYLVAMLLAISFAVTGPAGLSAAVAHAPQCPAGTNWDNQLQRCVPIT